MFGNYLKWWGQEGSICYFFRIFMPYHCNSNRNRDLTDLEKERLKLLNLKKQ